MPLRALAPLLALALVAAAPKPAAKPKPAFKPSAPRTVSFKTADGWTIAGTWRPAQLGRATVVLAHGVAASRQEWEVFATRLAAKGVGTLTIDLRGHGGSAAGPRGEVGFASFDGMGAWPRAVEDLRAAAWWLTTQGVPRARVAFGGASIGANLASVAAIGSGPQPFLLLLSPADDYRGVRLTADKSVKTLAAASLTDGRALLAVRSLETAAGAKVVTVARGHGVQIFDDAAALDDIVAWTVEAAK